MGQSFSQSESLSHSVTKSVSELLSQLVSQSLSQLVNESVSKSVSRLGCDSFSRSENGRSAGQLIDCWVIYQSLQFFGLINLPHTTLTLSSSFDILFCFSRIVKKKANNRWMWTRKQNWSPFHSMMVCYEPQ